jgi:hypothetical protein
VYFYNDDILKFLKTFTEIGTLDEPFDFSINQSSSSSEYLSELKKINNLYNSFLWEKDRLLNADDCSEIILTEEELKHILQIFQFYRTNDHCNCYLISDFLLSYLTTIKDKEYKNNVSNYKIVSDYFFKIISQETIKEIKKLSFDFYNKILDYNGKDKNLFFIEILEKIFKDFNESEEDKISKESLIKKFLEKGILLSEVINYDQNIEKHLEYYEPYLLNYEMYDKYEKFPEEMIFILSKRKLLKNKVIKSILNKIIDKINPLILNFSFKEKSFIMTIYEIDKIKIFLNKFLSEVLNLSKKNKVKIYECLNNLLFFKRTIVSEEEKIKIQMNEFKGEINISEKEIEKIINPINNDIYILYPLLVCDFEQMLNESLEDYSRYPINYRCNSYEVDSLSQIYLKPEEGFKNSMFTNYYEELGKNFTRENSYLKNILSGNYYVQMMKYLNKILRNTQSFINFLFESKEGKKALINKLIYKKEYPIKNDYVILSLNTLEIENNIIKLLKMKGCKIESDGFKNLNTLAEYFYNDKDIMNGLMHINYILYERHGLNIRNNIAHGNYFNKNIELEILNSFCALMFINNLLGKDMFGSEKK